MSSISSTTKAFSILGKLIYANVDTSVFTEVITNACDSHIIAKQTKPVEVTMTGPIIHIRDYGTGILPENIDTVYMKFFESTKEEDSSVCGKFGLGSKCIYYYNTGVFEVTSVVDGKESHYKFSGGDGKHPSKEIIYENVPSSAENGVTISFQVKKEFSSVKWHLAKLATFSSVPIDVSSIIITTDYYVETTPPILRGTKWKTYRQTGNVPSSCHLRGATIVQNGLIIQAPHTYSTENFMVFPVEDKAVPLSLDRTEIKLDADELNDLIKSLNKELYDHVFPILSGLPYELLTKAHTLLGHRQSYIAHLLTSISSKNNSILKEFEFNPRVLLDKWTGASEINAVYFINQSDVRYSKITVSYDVPKSLADYSQSWYILPPRLANGMNKVKQHMVDNKIYNSGVIVASDTTNKKDWCLGFDNYLLVDKTWKHTPTPVSSAPKVKDEDRIKLIKRITGVRDTAVSLSELKSGCKLVAVDDKPYTDFLDYDEYYIIPTLSGVKEQKIFDNYLKTNSIEVTSTKDVYDKMAEITSTQEFDDYMDHLCDSIKYSCSYNLNRFIHYLIPMKSSIVKNNIFTKIMAKKSSYMPAFSINYERVFHYIRNNTDNLYYDSLVKTTDSVGNVSLDVKATYPILYQFIESGIIRDSMLPDIIDYINLIDSQ